MYATQVSRRVQASPATVYRALIDPDAVAAWRVPSGMTSHVHAFDPREGGTFRVSLTYDEPLGCGKSGAHTDTYRGHFAKLLPNELVVEVMEFETDDGALRGTMTLTTSLTEVSGGTEIVMVHEGVPDDVPREDNELGTRMALDNLARLVESRG
ncbi:SRPBCC family protein [Streptomyces sp. NPDC005322]|uniref:SRPBCC family protein n=1 Tax=unclassified Streptomyces TaxID=2593676 RepID=UPI0033AFE8A1